MHPIRSLEDLTLCLILIWAKIIFLFMKED